jgi:hypothetical protein
LDSRLGGPQSRSGRGGEQKNSQEFKVDPVENELSRHKQKLLNLVNRMRDITADSQINTLTIDLLEQ